MAGGTRQFIILKARDNGKNQVWVEKKRIEAVFWEEGSVRIVTRSGLVYTARDKEGEAFGKVTRAWKAGAWPETVVEVDGPIALERGR